MVRTRRLAPPVDSPPSDAVSTEPSSTKATARSSDSGAGGGVPPARGVEARLLLLGVVVVLVGLLVMSRALGREMAETAAELAESSAVSLNAEELGGPLSTLLATVLPMRSSAEVGNAIVERRAALPGKRYPNVGAIADLRNADGERLLSSAEFRALKPSLVVRTPAEFRGQYWLWSLLSLAALLTVHVVWRARGFAGDGVMLAAVTVLSGVGLLMMASVRDPLRDLLLMRPFAQGVIGGAIVLLVASMVDFERPLIRRSGGYALLAALGLSVLLLLFGTGPSGSDAKVNLFGAQPVEVIKVLVVFFLATYFCDRWELLREVREERTELDGVQKLVTLPKLEYSLPPLLAVACFLVFFFLQRDLGPALVLSCSFLVLYGVARGRALMAGVGFAFLILGFVAGYVLGFPATVKGRLEMWLSPWDNTFRGGDHLAHSLWALASGGVRGVGLGGGSPETVPEVHTDMVLSAVGEQLGAIGLASVITLWAVILWRGLRASWRSGTYGMFLGLGLVLAMGLQMVLIAGGVVGLLPLSGVVSPFLSYGRSAMLVNFGIIGVLASLSARPPRDAALQFRPALRKVGVAFAVMLAALLGRGAQLQIMVDERATARGVLALQADGERRFRYNPRLVEMARSIPRGSILDRNGLPLATSDWAEVEAQRAVFEDLGLRVGESVLSERHYPLGGRTFHVLGDWTTQQRWGATNASFVERDFRTQLQGFDDGQRSVQIETQGGAVSDVVARDYSELVPMIRQRPKSRAVRELIERDRSLRLSLDARLQVKSAEILERRLQGVGPERGAVVVLDAESGDVLALVSHPWPKGRSSSSDSDAEGVLFDRARYGLYPPGSTFKIAVAIAALRRDPDLLDESYTCERLGDGRVGQSVKGWGRPIRDDPRVRTPHGRVDMVRGVAVSCNAYFAQLAVYALGEEAIIETASLFGIEAASPNDAATLADSLAQAAYGQGQVLATPLEMARVAAVIASGGQLPAVRLELDGPAPISRSVLPREQTLPIAEAMRRVVTEGSASRVLSESIPAIAGKTGTAEVQGEASHAWFIGFAPYGASGRKIALSVLVEHGGYGGLVAARVAGDIVKEAAQLGLL